MNFYLVDSNRRAVTAAESMLNPICPLIAVPEDDGDDIVVQNMNYHLTSRWPTWSLGKHKQGL
jgi:hypothetical protein